MTPTITTRPNGTGPQTWVEWGHTPDGEFERATCGTAEEARDVMTRVAAADGVTDFITGDAAYGESRRRFDAHRARLDAELAEASRIACTPVIGEGATIHYPSDKMPYVVVGISATGSKVTLEPLREPTPATGHTHAGTHNGFPVIDHEYTADELAAGSPMRHDTRLTTAVYRRKNGRYYDGSLRVTFGGARYYRDYSD